MGITGVARAAAHRYRRAADLRKRQVPRIRPTARRGEPSVYYLVPHSARPHGGIRVVYRHVRLLAAMGIRAAVLQTGSSSRPEWFDSDVPFVSASRLDFASDDILVVPEIYGPTIAQLDPSIRVLIFNQGGYITFDHLGLSATMPGAPYRQIPRLEGIMTVSRDSAALLALAFADTPIDVARPVIDGEIFHPSSAPRENTFAFVPTRRRDEVNQILHIVRARGLGWQPRPLEGLTEAEMARALQRSALFLSLSDRDGFGLPPAEAMASGCYVVGYPGGGGDEFFDPDYCIPATSTAEVIAALEQATQLPESERRAAGERAAAAILGRYSTAGLRDDLSRIYGRLL